MADTIFALASAPGRAGVAVVRVSGHAAQHSVQQLTGRPLPVARRAVLRRLAFGGAEIDQVLLLWFPGPASFTGEDVVEFHIHGGRAVREALFAALAGLGLRPAEPGEFSRRAVENGRLDLTRAEAIADLVDAETPAQLRQALRQQDGVLADLYEAWRADLIRALGRAEAAIDFSDDGVGEAEFDAARHAAQHVAQQISNHLADHRGEMLREGLRLTILGPPNAGKSSLLNALARRDVAIVSDMPGTTRDIVEARLNLGGYLVQVSDTAGVREAVDPVEKEGVRRALARAGESDLTLLLLDGSAPDPRQGLPPMAAPDLTIWNKADLGFPAPREGAAISLKTGAGVAELVERLIALVRGKLEGGGTAPALTRPRHRHALTQAYAALQHGLATPPGQPELLAEDLRLAVRHVGRITGRVDVEELLDFVFRDFCVGK